MALNWYELHPGFTIPRNIDASQFPPFTDFDPDLPDPFELIVLPWTDTIPSWGWAAWRAYETDDKLPKMNPDLLQAIAWRKYGTARYIALVPVWRRWMSDIAGELDDVEDQLSTILWIVELLGKKLLPIPPGVLAGPQQLQRLLDDAQEVLRYSGSSRTAKVEFREKQREARARTRVARGRTAKILTWLQNNYGRLLEAAQATGGWFDVGIILGPIFGYIEEGLWGVATNTLDNYLIALDALWPGYREAYYENAERLTTDLEDAMAGFMEELLYQAELDQEYYGYFGV